MKPVIIAIDADGTCFTHEYPNIGKDIGAVPVLKALVENGHKLILWTMRDHQHHINWSGRDFSSDIVPTEQDCLQEALDWFKQNGIKLWGVNKNPDQTWSGSPKAYAQIYIDDAALGIPLVYPVSGDRPFVNWLLVSKLLWERALLSEDQFKFICQNFDAKIFEGTDCDE